MQVKILLKVGQGRWQEESEFQAKGTAHVNQISDSKRRVMMEELEEVGGTGGAQRYAMGRGQRADYEDQIGKDLAGHSKELRPSSKDSGQPCRPSH